MSEELNMDKGKNPRLFGASSRAVSERSKQDSSKFSKNGKNQFTHQHHHETYHNPKKTSKKVKGVDKRPKPRSFFNQPMERDRGDEIAPLEEVGSVQKPGSKKINLNHLLNFTYNTDERSTSHHVGYDHGRRVRKKSFNKEQFLQANCRFIVKNSGEYEVQMADADVLVDWSLIEEILIKCFEIPNCPICLYPPQAAKMTRCGHIFCWPCILHYLALSDKTWRKCPICYEAVKREDLKSVSAMVVPAYNVNDHITMQLMTKQRGSVVVTPVLRTNESRLENEVFSKLMKVSMQDVNHNILDREEKELNSLFDSNEDNPEECFIQQALQLLLERRDNNKRYSSVPTLVQQLESNVDEDVLIMTKQNSSSNNNIVVYSNAFDDEKLCDARVSDLSNQSATAESVGENNVEFVQQETDNHEFELPSLSQHRKESIYFYQAIDGQPMYLHPLNVKMLAKQYGSLEYCPETITAKIVQMEGNTMDEMLRKRLRYLSHLPLHCEFVIVELEFKETHLSRETLNSFIPDVNKRKHLRQRKARDERKRERLIKTEEAKKHGIYPNFNVDVCNTKHFPSCSDSAAIEINDFVPLAIPSLCLNSESLNETSGMDQGPSCNPETASFAKMLREGIKKAPTMLCSQDNKPINVAEHSSDEVQFDSSVQAPDYHQSFSNAIQTAFDTLSVNESEDRNSGGKRKKNKKKLLFSTNMNRSK